VRLYVEPMDVVVIECDAEGAVHVEGEGWKVPTLQERRAILFAAEQELAALGELVEMLVRSPGAGRP
jgi:hypothetical protein